MSDEPTTLESLDLLNGGALTGKGETWVAHWPWHNQAVDSCLWLLTDGMTASRDS